MRGFGITYLYVMSVPYVAAIACIALPKLWGLRYTGFLWSAILVLGFFLLLQNRRKIPFPWKIWLPWFSYVGLSLSWSSLTIAGNLQVLLQMVTPLFIGVAASLSIQNEADWDRFKRGFMHGFFFIALVFLFFWYGPGVAFQTEGTGFNVRPSAMTLCLMSCLFLSRMHTISFGNILAWVACLSICFFSGSRMAITVLLLLWIISPLYRNIWGKTFVICVVCLIAVSLFHTPTFQQRFFVSGSGTFTQIVEGDFNDQGRFQIWPLVWEKARKNIVFGAGVGESDIFVYRNFDPIRQVHNDYLRIIFEFGLVGLVLFVGAAFLQIVRLRRMMYSNDRTVIEASVAGYLGFFTWLILSTTDNGIIYGLAFTHPLFAITGAAYGLHARRLKYLTGS